MIVIACFVWFETSSYLDVLTKNFETLIISPLYAE